MSKIGDIRTALSALLMEHERDGALPTNGRFLFYELVALGVVSKSHQKGRQPNQNVSDALLDLRESGEIPWEWIIDETRSLEDYTGYLTIKDSVLARLDYARLDPWDREAPLILTESRSLAGVLRDLSREYAVRIAATNGQCGGFLHTEITPILRPFHRVLYLGDWDLCGNMIEQNTRRVLERASGHELQWERLALTTEQVEQYDLPRIIKHDGRFKNGGGRHEAVETEALSQRLIVEILRVRLDELLPEPLASVHVRADEERAVIQAVLEVVP